MQLQGDHAESHRKLLEDFAETCCVAGLLVFPKPGLSFQSMDEERESCIARLAMVNDRLAFIKQQRDSLHISLQTAFESDPRQAPEIYSQMTLLDGESIELHEERDRLEAKMTMKQWIHQTLPGINYFENQSSGGSSSRYEGYWPQDLKKWEDFRANVRAHVNELESRDTQYSRNTYDFEGLIPPVDCTHSNIRQRLTEILKAFLKYEPFKECAVQLSVSREVEERASAQPSTEASAESTEANAAVGPIQMARSDRVSPDISVQNGEKKYFLVVECKRPIYIRKESANVPDLASPATNMLKETIQQITKYMVRRKVGHAMLTSEDLTYFFRIEGQSMFISDGLVWNSLDIPWLGAIHYILHRAKDVTNVSFSNYGTGPGPQQAGSKRQKKTPLGTGSATTQHQVASDVSASCHLREARLALKEVNVVELNIAKSNYSHGSNGSVALGQMHDQQVIIKIAPINNRRGQRLLHEIAVYYSLQHLWGQSIPHLVDYGSTVNGSLVYLATEYIPGLHLDRVLISEEVASAARKALGAIHCSGVLHGDLHAGNILVVDEDVRIIDFGFAQYSHARSNQERELDHLEEILQRSRATPMTDE